MLTKADVRVIKEFIEYQIRISFNHQTFLESEEIAYLLALAEDNQVEILALARKIQDKAKSKQDQIPQRTDDIVSLVGNYIQESSSRREILKNRRHVLESDSEIIKLYIRLDILDYLRENKHLAEHLFDKLKKTVENELVEGELKNKNELLEKLKVAYDFLHSNRADLSKKQLVKYTFYGVCLVAFLPASYFLYNCINLFSMLGNLSFATKYLLQTILPSFAYVFVPFSIGVGLGFYSNVLGRRIEGNAAKVQENVNELYFMGITKVGYYPTTNALVQELKEYINNLEKEIVSLEQKQDSYCKTTTALTNGEPISTLMNVREEATINQSPKMTESVIVLKEEIIDGFVTNHNQSMSR